MKDLMLLERERYFLWLENKQAKKIPINALFEIIGERERTQLSLSLCLNKQEGRDLAELM